MKIFSTFTGIGGFEIGIQNAYRSTLGTLTQDTARELEERERLFAETGEDTNPSLGQFGERFTNFFNEGPLFVGYSEIDKYAISVYEKQFGDKLNFIELGQIKNKGILKQNSDYSYSRESLKNDKAKLKSKENMTDEDCVITFKALEEDFNAESKMHFGATQGRNSMSGKNITVIGTPHFNNTAYLLMAYSLGYEVTDTTMKYQQIERNGYRFPFMTYNDEFLREIQLNFIESELLQAVGRARLVAHDCVVTLFSNYPLPQAEQMKNKVI